MVLLVLVAVLAAPVLGALKLPENYPLCKRSDPNIDTCLKDAVQKVLSNDLAKGIPKLGLLSVDPLEVSSVDIDQGQGPVSINLKFRNLVVHGLTKGSLTHVKTDLDNYHMMITGSEPKLILFADYEMNGRILVVPVQGKGRCNFTFTDLDSILNIKGEALKKGADTYMDVKEFPINITSLGLLEVSFENLFNGDKTLGPTLNTLLNENWRELWAELKPAFEGTFSAVFKEFSNRIFNKVPFKDIFLD